MYLYLGLYNKHQLHLEFLRLTHEFIEKGKRAQEKRLETWTFLGCKLLILRSHFVYFCMTKKLYLFLTITV